MILKRFRWLRTPGVLLMLLCMVFPSLAGSTPETSAHKVLDQPSFIRLRSGSFDPLRALPALPDRLSYTPAEATAAGTYIVQFTGPVMDDWKQALVATGAQLGGYLPDYAFLAHLDAAALERAQNLPFVRWVGPYQPAYKLAPDVDYNDTRSYRVVLAPWADAAVTQTALTQLAAQPQSYGQGFSAVLSAAQLDQVARLADVIWIEPVYLRRVYNDVGGGTIMGGSTAWGNGYTGSGVTIAVADTGLDTGIAGTIHQDFSGRITDAHISSWPVVYADYGGGCAIENGGDDDGASDLESGHGTHVAGSVAGNGARSSGQFKGLGYEATVTFQAIEQFTDWSDACALIGLSDGYYLTGIPNDVQDLLTEAYTWGARVHNNSWGGGDFGVYDQTASQFDDFIYDNPDMTVVVAAGNEGIDDDADGYVDENSISSPGTAKNVISVGASDNERASGGYQATWNQGWGSDYPANPTRDDHVSDDRDELAAFSSRGPMADGRIKPDVVAPGTNILSVRSSLATESGWGSYNTYYMYMGGTSMASPLTAGAATLVREYYVEGEGHASPSAALIKATLINSAVDITGYGNSSEEAGQPIPNNHEGWGRVNVAAATTPGSRQFVDHSSGVSTGATATYYYSVQAGQPFKVTLVWSDYAASAAANPTLVNNLNLRLTAPNGTTTYWGNNFSGGWSSTGGSADAVNNVENVYVQSPTAGTWKVEVIGQNVPQGPQPFALVVDGSLSEELDVTGIQPGKAPNNAVLNNAVVSGSGFESTAVAHLVRGMTVVTGTASTVYTDTDTIVADFNLNGAAAGWWDARVTNSVTDTATLTEALFVVDATLPDLEIAKTAATSQVESGGVMTYTIVISNAGQVIATDVTFTDTLPADLTFESLTPACHGGTVVLPDGFACTVNTISMTAGAEIEYTLVVNVAEDAEGTLDNQVVVGSNETDGYVFDNSAQASVQVRAGGGTVYLPFVIKSPAPPPLPNTVDSIADACVLQGYPTSNLGNFVDMWAGYDDYLDPDGGIARSFVQFDLSDIPAGTSINNATLYLYLEGSWDFPGQSRTITIYRLGSSWSESSVTWNTQPSIAEAYGSASVTHGNWGWYAFNVTALLQGWVNGSWANYGLAIRGPEHSGSDSSWKSFYTREGDYVPYIAITYTSQTAQKTFEPVATEIVPGAAGLTISDLLGGKDGMSR